MYSKEQLQGIVLSLATPEITMFASNANKNVSHICRLRVVIRSTNSSLLEAIQRTLNQYMIKSVLKSQENKQRQRPILILGNKASLRKMIRLIPEEVPTSHKGWNFFDKMLSAM